MADNDIEMVRIYHPGIKLESTQPRSSLGVWYRSGWTLVTADAPAGGEAVPEPVTESQVKAAQQEDAKDPAAADAKAAKPASKSAKE